LITGGAGFIGSHLSDAYLQRGDEVFVIDDLSTGSIENIQHLKGNPRFHYTIETVLNQPVVAELVDQCDVIFHLAAAVGVRLIVESPVRTIETNVRGTEVILGLANKKKKKTGDTEVKDDAPDAQSGFVAAKGSVPVNSSKKILVQALKKQRQPK